jgi:hypothetical protein
MGASGWEYFVPYQPDINGALQKLREDVFRQGRYYKRPSIANEETDETTLYTLPPEVAEIVREELAYLKSLPEPTTPDELLQYNYDSGTHSIIDLISVTTTPEFGTASPLTPQQLDALLGTDKPTRAMIDPDHILTNIHNWRGRGEGLYIIVYQDDQPSEIFFTGFSGD